MMLKYLAAAAVLLMHSATNAALVTINFSGSHTSPATTNVVSGSVSYDDNAITTSIAAGGNDYFAVYQSTFSSSTLNFEFFFNGERFNRSSGMDLLLFDWIGINSFADDIGQLRFYQYIPAENLFATFTLQFTPAPFAASDFTPGQRLRHFRTTGGMLPTKTDFGFITASEVPVYTMPVAISIMSAGAVPEPASWALMIAGMGAVGHALRRRRIARGAAVA